MEASLILVSASILLSFISGIESTSFIIKNNCPYTIWPAALGNAGGPQIGNTGFTLGQGASNTIGAPTGWSGRLWARTFCGTDGSGRFSCSIGDCGTGQVSCNNNGGANPASLVEFTVQGGGGNDYYDISLIDGFNLPVKIERGGCPTVNCGVNINSICPSGNAVRLSNGAVVGCRSDPSFFKAQCPQAYANPPDPDTFACGTGGDYVITWCP